MASPGSQKNATPAANTTSTAANSQNVLIRADLIHVG